MITLSYTIDASQKYWEAHVDGAIYAVRYGQRGTPPRQKVTQCVSHIAAYRLYRQTVCEKLAKGYKPSWAWYLASIDIDMKPSMSPCAIASAYIGEVLSETIVREICTWGTACLRHNMPLKQFTSTWEKLQEDGLLSEALGYTGEEFWLDMTEWGVEFPEIYAKALEQHGDRFLWFDSNADIHLVAVRGNPGAHAIEVCVFGEEANGIWPASVGPGALIAYMDDEFAHLQNGMAIAEISCGASDSGPEGE